MLSSPDRTITAPKADYDISSKNDDISSIIDGFLSPGSVLTAPAKDKDAKPVRAMDIDGDGSNEIAAAYANESRDIKSGALILKKGKKTWEKVMDAADGRSSVDSMELTDITGDGTCELLLMRGGNLEIHYVNKGDTEGRQELIKCTAYKIEDTGGISGRDGMLELIARNEQPSELDIYVRRWNGYTLDDVTYEYPEYTEEMLSFYTKKLDGEQGTDRDLYQIGELQISLGMYDDGLKSLSKSIEVCGGTLFKSTVKAKKGDLLVKLERFDEAQAVYKSMADDGSKDAERIGAARVYEARKEYDEARKIYNSISQFFYCSDVQRVDAAVGEDKIFNLLQGAGEYKYREAIRSIGQWGKDSGFIVNCTVSDMKNSDMTPIVFVDFHKDTEKVYGKNDVGAHCIFYWEGDKLNRQVYWTGRDIAGGVPTHGLSAGFISQKAEVSKLQDGTVELKVTFRDSEKGGEKIKTFHLKNGTWKIFWR
jgi:hypothetical protein